jgi:hypothetical protein
VTMDLLIIKFFLNETTPPAVLAILGERLQRIVHALK